MKEVLSVTFFLCILFPLLLFGLILGILLAPIVDGFKDGYQWAEGNN